ncbi:DMT family transporter [Fulvivirga sp. M361]|nr:DMT family transporter [Fulvivirga sp. M361]
MMISTFLFAIMNVFIKLVPNIPAVEIVFFRSLISLVISAGWLRASKIDLFGKRENRPLLILRGCSGAIALVSFFYLLQVIPLATATVLRFLAPVFTAILGIMIVKEKVKPVQWLFFAIAFSGIILVQGFDYRITPLYVLLGLGASFFSGLAYNFIRKIKTNEDPLVIILYFPLITGPLTGIYSAFHWVQPKGIEWLYLLCIGLLTQFAQYFMTKSYQMEELSKVSSITYTGILYALCFGWIFFDEQFNFMTYLGMGLVMMGVAFNVWYKNRQAKLLK